MAEVFKVGKVYRVPCVRGRYYHTEGWWPVLGDFHEDKLDVGFDPWHFHLDFRFLRKWHLRRFRDEIRGHNDAAFFARASPLQLHSGGGGQFTADNPPLVVLKRRLCKREWTQNPALYEKTHFVAALERRYATAYLKAGRCPHRGADLSTIAPDADGCVECPLHGLRWNVATGRLVFNNLHREAAECMEKWQVDRQHAEFDRLAAAQQPLVLPTKEVA